MDTLVSILWRVGGLIGGLIGGAIILLIAITLYKKRRMPSRKKGNILELVKESADFLYRHCNEIDKIYNQVAPLLAQYERSEKDRIKKEFVEKENGLQDIFLRERQKIRALHAQTTNREAAALQTAIVKVNARIEEMRKGHQAQWLSFHDPFWEEFSPIKDMKEPPLIRFGELQISDKNIPALLRIITSKNLIINAAGSCKDAAVAALQSIMLRLLVNMPPGRANFILIDPAGPVANMAGFAGLTGDAARGAILTGPDHIERQLVNLSEHIETVIQKCLRNNFSTVEQYNEDAGGAAEPYRFLIITNFPANFGETAAQRLISIACNGPRAGVYVLILRDTALDLPYNFNIQELERVSTIIHHDGERFVWDDPYFKEHRLVLDGLPSADRVNRLLELTGERPKSAVDAEVPFEIALEEIKNWWSLKSYDGVSAPIGLAGARRVQYFTLGKGALQHVLIAGKTGSGKSNLLHVMILSLCISYSPEELELYLVDFKKGIEFKSYAAMELPHAKVIAIQSEREFALSVLKALDYELQKRGGLFRHAGVRNLSEFRLKNGSAKLSRIILLVDEFQEFFKEDDGIASQATLLIYRLVREGSAFGIHIILASQAMAASHTLTRFTTDKMAVRITLQRGDADSNFLRPGEAVYNDANGAVAGDNAFRVLYLSDEDRERYLKELNRFYKGQIPNAENNLIVFEGNAPAKIAKNPILNELLNNYPSSGNSAPMAWLGEPIAIKPHKAAVFKRQGRSNLLIIGHNEEAGSAMLITSLIGLAAQKSTVEIEFYILDLSYAPSPWNKIINTISKFLEHYNIKIYAKNNTNEAIAKVYSVLKEREAPEGGCAGKSIFFILFGLQRAMELKSMDGYTYPDSANNLFYILRNGPDLGIHTICWGDTLRNVEAILSRHTTEFDLRVAMQMSIAESMDLIGSPEADKLGPYRAIFYDEENTGKLEQFLPYAIPSEDWLLAVSDRIRRRLKKQAL